MASAHNERGAGGPLLPGRPAPVLTVAPPSLAMALPTAMLLVDYAARGKTTPGAWPVAAARRVPSSLLDSALGVRAVLGHGDGLRRFLLLSLPAGHPGHRSWPALRDHVAGLGVEGFAELIEYGVAGNIVYGERTGYPLSAADRSALAHAGRAAGDLARELRVAWLLAGWGVADPPRTARQVADPEWFGRHLLALLDAIVSAGFERVWSESLPGLEAAGASAQTAPPGTPPREWVSRVSGLVPDGRWEPWFEQAATVACVPCPLLGRHLTIFATGPLGEWQSLTGVGAAPETGDIVWVGYEPQPTVAGRTASPSSPPAAAGTRTYSGVAAADGARETGGADHAPGAGVPGGDGSTSGVSDTAGAAELRGTASSAGTRTDAVAGGASGAGGAGRAEAVAAAADLGRLGRLGAQVTALGDQTRLSILLTLAGGARTAQQLADELGIHLSTVSRQVGQLEQAGLVTVARRANVRHYDVDRAAVRRLCQTIEHALG